MTGNSNGLINLETTDNWERVDLRSLMSKVNEAAGAKKWLFVWDKLGTVSSFFRYQQRLCEFGNEMKAVKRGARTLDMALEMLAYHVECVQRSGGRLLVDLDDSSPDFNDRAFSTGENFSAEKAFEGGHLPAWQGSQWDQGRQMTDFGLALRCSAENEEEMLAVLNKIPNSDKFEHVIVEEA